LLFDVAPNDVIFDKTVICKQLYKWLAFGVMGQLFVKEKPLKDRHFGPAVMLMSPMRWC
jgi:hypothetical protein